MVGAEDEKGHGLEAGGFVEGGGRVRGRPRGARGESGGLGLSAPEVCVTERRVWTRVF